MQRVVVGITGASGSIYGVRLLEVLKQLKVESHVIVSKMGIKVVKYETGYSPESLKGLACWHDVDDLFAPVASGSFQSGGMVVVPCSMHTLGAVAQGVAGNLLLRAADVMLKEGRPLVLVPREAPVNKIHVSNMLRVLDAGARLIPASPAFYHQPSTMEELIDFLVGKILDNLGFEHNLYKRWGN